MGDVVRKLLIELTSTAGPKEVAVLYRAWYDNRDAVRAPLPDASDSVIAELQRIKEDSQAAFAAWQKKKEDILTAIGITYDFGGVDGYTEGALTVTSTRRRVMWSGYLEDFQPHRLCLEWDQTKDTWARFAEKTGVSSEPKWLMLAGYW